MTSTIRSALLSAGISLFLVAPAHAFKVVTTYDGKNGEDAFSAPIQGSDGNIYGTTVYGGAGGHGTFYRLAANGKYEVLYSFCAQAGCTDGSNPEWLTQGADGNFYGETYDGGAQNAGTLFRLTPDGRLETLYSFCSQANCTDGALPQSALVQTADGSFYGTTVIGGANNQGTVFRFSDSGGLSILHDFCSKSGCPDGAQPNIGLTLASDGNFYGAAALGGNHTCQYGCGTVFRITPKGKFTTLYTFCAQADCVDGSVPQGLLIEGKKGVLYGTTDTGGAGAVGTVFRISVKGELATLHSFCTGDCSDGMIPYAGVIRARDGKFYGTASVGGTGGLGTVFRMTAAGSVTALASFDGGTDGAFPASALLQANNGQLYGGTEEGGNDSCSAPSGCGVLYRLSADGAAASTHGGVRSVAPMPRAIPASPLEMGSN